VTPSSLLVDIQKEGAAALAELQKEGTRRLTNTVGNTVVTNPLTGMMSPVTTTLPSSFDSSDGSAGSGSSAASLESSKSSESGSFRQMPAGLEKISGFGASTWGGVVCQLVVSICFAAIYYQNAVWPVLMNGSMVQRYGYGYGGYRKDDFDTSIVGCADDMWVCVHGLCCPLVRMSHTNAIAGIMGYWQTAILWTCCSAFTAGLGPCCLMVYWRKQLKEIMGIEDHILNDICVTCFCPWLAICQQGTAVDQAMGYEVTGCCTLEYGSPYGGSY